MTLEEIAQVTTANALRLFSIRENNLFSIRENNNEVI